MKTKDLSPRQQAFVAEYLIDLNVTAAYRRAGYTAKNADANALRMMGNDGIKAAISAALASRSARTQVTSDRVLTELARVAYSDMRAFAEWGPGGITLKASGELGPDDSPCVAEVSETVTESGGSKRFKLHDKVQALTLLGRHLGMFADKLEVGGQVVVVRDDNWYGRRAPDRAAKSAGSPAPGAAVARAA